MSDAALVTPYPPPVEVEKFIVRQFCLLFLNIHQFLQLFSLDSTEKKEPDSLMPGVEGLDGKQQRDVKPPQAAPPSTGHTVVLCLQQSEEREATHEALDVLLN